MSLTTQKLCNRTRQDNLRILRPRSCHNQGLTPALTLDGWLVAKPETQLKNIQILIPCLT